MNIAGGLLCVKRFSASMLDREKQDGPQIAQISTDQTKTAPIMEAYCGGTRG
jgi:hypothetical protein